VEDFAAFARRNDITLSIAHTNANFDDVMRAFDLGFRHVTHFYSLTPTVVREKGFRIAGVIEAAYYLDDIDVEIIADGCHLPDALLKLIRKIKGTAHVALITDAMRAAGQDVTESFLGSAEDPNPVVIEDGVAKLLSREAFAGSIATADRLLRTMVQSGTPLCDAVRMLTENPVRMMGIKERIGALREGYAADLCLFDENIEIKAVFKNGRKVV
jgi:N-acetylglucosamine-6-phosphate deacetylase